ncbi:hypothetical protein OKW43_000049 [Paraburkholderia sp. WC7.3g]|uniref:hypothetical protein n=1 Tax=Paraburkholderia sp. WC7.3g TaxID=2991070 RepID=UPI003D21EC12
MTDTERLDFMAKHCLSVSENDNGEWQVFEFTPRFYGDGIVTRNSFHASARDAIDYAIVYYLGGMHQYGDPRHSVTFMVGEDLDVIGSFPFVDLMRNSAEPDQDYRMRLIAKMQEGSSGYSPEAVNRINRL